MLEAIEPSEANLNREWTQIHANDMLVYSRSFASIRGSFICRSHTRKDAPIPENVVNTLANLDVESLQAVEKGQPAPDFTLKSLDGPEFTLSQFKGVKPVVLVFVYGDS